MKRTAYTKHWSTKSEYRIVIPIDDLGWEDQEVADGAPVTSLVRLPSDVPGRGFTVLVRFPVGWARPYSGFYESTEEIIVLEGWLQMSSETLAVGDYGWYPAGYLRSNTSCPEGALVLAWFSGPARWHRASHPAEGFAPEEVIIGKVASVVMEPGPLGGGRARLLRRGLNASSWVIDLVPRIEAPAESVVELFALDEMSWLSVPAGHPLPAGSLPTFCRITRLDQN